MKRFLIKSITKRAIVAITTIVLLIGCLAGCGTAKESSSASSEASETTSETTSETMSESISENVSETVSETTEDSSSQEEKTSQSNIEIITTVANVTSGGAIDVTDMFTDRDMRQNVDISDAERITVSDGKDVEITKEGIYVISGTAENVGGHAGIHGGQSGSCCSCAGR